MRRLCLVVLATAGVLCGASAAFAQTASPSREAFRKIGEPGALEITRLPDGSAHAELTSGGRDCGGIVTGRLAKDGDALRMTRTDAGDPCELTITRTGEGASVREGDCHAWHGPGCAYAGAYRRQR